MENNLESAILREYLRYIRSDEAREKTTETVLEQISEFLNYQYPHSEITVEVDGTQCTFKVEGPNEDRGLILIDLEQMGAI